LDSLPNDPVTCKTGEELFKWYSQLSKVQLEIFKLLTLDCSTHFDKMSHIEAFDVERNTKKHYLQYVNLFEGGRWYHG
jgi:hypothetical protein